MNSIVLLPQENKVTFAKFVKARYGADIDPDSLFDIQVGFNFEL